MSATASTNGYAARSRTRTSELLRIATAGSVDDGKSTLIGRLLHDSKSILEDQLEHVQQTSERRGDGYLNLALLTDGLRAEREQGITIDVAYRYFQTPRRKFIIADTPGHEQYTRNMVTGASTADLSIVLVDARNGVSEQTRRHAFIASLLRIPHVVVCVNKMDLVGYDEDAFYEILEEVTDWAARLQIPDMTFIPISALHGDNVVDRSHGDAVVRRRAAALPPRARRDRAGSQPQRRPLPGPVGDPPDERGAPRLPRLRGPGRGRRAAPRRRGRRAAGRPANQHRRRSTRTRASVEAAFPTMCVALRLGDQIDISRGDMIVAAEDQPVSARELEAMICWMSEQPMQPRGRYTIKHTTRNARAIVDQVEYRVDVNTLDHVPAQQLALNEIGRVHVCAAARRWWSTRTRATGRRAASS